MAELTLKVVKTWLETPTIPAIRLGLASQNFPFKAGQYCLVELKINGEYNDHAFSIACAPNGEYLEFATRMGDSAFKKAFAALREGDEVKITGPLGNFTLEENAKSISFLSGGIGITPIRSMVQQICREKSPTSVTLLFGNRNPAEIPFKAELNELQRQNPNFKAVHIVSEGNSEWKGLVGRIDAELVKKHTDVESALYYICGPPGMVDSLANILKTLGVADERIKIEHFTGYK